MFFQIFLLLLLFFGSINGQNYSEEANWSDLPAASVPSPSPGSNKWEIVTNPNRATNISGVLLPTFAVQTNSGEILSEAEKEEAFREWGAAIVRQAISNGRTANSEVQMDACCYPGPPMANSTVFHCAELNSAQMAVAEAQDFFNQLDEGNVTLQSLDAPIAAEFSKHWNEVRKLSDSLPMAGGEFKNQLDSCISLGSSMISQLSPSDIQSLNGLISSYHGNFSSHPIQHNPPPFLNQSWPGGFFNGSQNVPWIYNSTWNSTFNNSGSLPWFPGGFNGFQPGMPLPFPVPMPGNGPNSGSPISFANLTEFFNSSNPLDNLNWTTIYNGTHWSDGNGSWSENMNISLLNRGSRQFFPGNWSWNDNSTFPWINNGSDLLSQLLNGSENGQWSGIFNGTGSLPENFNISSAFLQNLTNFNFTDLFNGTQMNNNVSWLNIPGMNNGNSAAPLVGALPLLQKPKKPNFSPGNWSWMNSGSKRPCNWNSTDVDIFLNETGAPPDWVESILRGSNVSESEDDCGGLLDPRHKRDFNVCSREFWQKNFTNDSRMVKKIEKLFGNQLGVIEAFAAYARSLSMTDSNFTEQCHELLNKTNLKQIIQGLKSGDVDLSGIIEVFNINGSSGGISGILSAFTAGPNNYFPALNSSISNYFGGGSSSSSPNSLAGLLKSFGGNILNQMFGGASNSASSTFSAAKSAILNRLGVNQFGGNYQPKIFG